MKTLIALVVVLSASTATAIAPKDPRIEIAKKETAKLYREYMSNTFKKLNILEQSNSYFLTQVVGRDKKNICFILEVNLDSTPPVSFIENKTDASDKEFTNVFLRECTDKPTADELNHFKAMNSWPVTNN